MMACTKLYALLMRADGGVGRGPQGDRPTQGDRVTPFSGPAS